jgi:hypothetical protein
VTEEKNDAQPFALFGRDLFGEIVKPTARCVLSGRFILPPFSVLDARQGDWRERKRAWLSLGIQSEIGRGADLTYNGPEVKTPGLNHYRDEEKKKVFRGANAQSEMALRLAGGFDKHPAHAEMLTRPHYSEQEYDGRLDISGGTGYVKGTPALCNGTLTHITQGTSPEIAERFAQSGVGTSIFDPTLCEVMYTWFCPPGGVVLDPFAGGSVRGVVAGCLGYEYIGIDLSEAQVEANRVQAEEICDETKPEYHVGDARRMDLIIGDNQADFLFTCPPYGSLERYSDDERDLSTLEPAEFREEFAGIIAKAAACLKPDRFGAVVVGDYRDKRGMYNNFPGQTAEAFRAAGMHLYNEAILITAVGSLPIRVTGQFRAGRKLGKTHQNILVFVKGDWKKAVAAICPPCAEGEETEQ